MRTNGARYAEAALLMGYGNYAQAEAVIEAMLLEKNLRSPEEQERQRMLTYIEVLADAADDGRNAYQLTTQEVNALENMATDHYDRPSNWAYNLLCYVYGKCRAPWTGGEATPKSRSYQTATAQTTALHALFVQPNPARTWVAFNYRFAPTTVQASIVVHDLAGRVVHQERVSGTDGQVLWDIRDVGPGSYTVSLVADGATLSTERLIVQ